MMKQFLKIQLIGMCLLWWPASALLAQEQVPLLKRADVHYLRGEYAQAAALYEKLCKKKSKRWKQLTLEQKLAHSYREINRYEDAARWYAVLLQDPAATPDNYLYYGDMLKSMGKYDEARRQYELFAAKSNRETVAARLAGCDSAVLWMAAPQQAMLRDEKDINTSLSDWGAVPYKGKLILVSDSLRGDMWHVKGSRHKDGRTRNAYFKLYSASEQSSGYGYVKNFSPVVNDYRYHVGPVCFTRNGDTAYVTITNPQRKIAYDKKERPVYGTRRLELWVFVWKNNEWQRASVFPYNKPDEYAIGHATLNEAGNILYFSSDQPGGTGKSDIWYSEKQSDGTWGTPRHTGTTLNTAEEEAFPVAGPGNTLYYSSKGLAGMGGYDIFRTAGSGSSWSTPVNMKVPFNSSGDDFYYVTGEAGKGFLSSNRAGGKGSDDIYSFATDQPPLTTVPTAVPLLRIPFSVTVCVNRETCVYLYNKKRDMGWCYMVMSPSREITATLEPDTEYEIRIHHPGKPVEVIPFDTRNLTGTDTLIKKICP